MALRGKMYYKKEESVREARTIEATRKRFMGPSGKIGCIVKNLGQPIIASGSPNYEVTYLDDPFRLHDPEDFETLDEDEISYQIGWHFDGLNRGMNLEIKYLEDLKDLTVRWNCHVVYHEVNGELHGYAPYEEWEKNIEALYDLAKQKENHHRKKLREDHQRIAEKRSKELLRKMHEKWGI
jgi:hypothetical protein